MTTIPSQTLSTALRAASTIVEARNTLPLLSMVAFTGTELVTSNLDIEFRQSFSTDFACAVDAGKIKEWALKASGDVAMTLDGNILTVKSGRSRMALPSLSVDDFPILPVEGLGKAMAVDLAEPVKRTLWAASPEPTRAYLSGVFMCAEGAKARFVSTDGYRMPIVTTAAKWPKGAPDITLPAPLAKIIADTGPGSLEWSDRLVRFTAGDVTITGKTLSDAGSFPDHRVQLAKVAGEPYAVDAGEMVEAVRRVRIASDAQQRKVRLSRRDGAIGIRIEGTSGFDATDEIDADCTEGFETCFNADFLAGMLAAAGEDSVSIEQEGPGAMMRVSPIASGDLKFEGLLWPLRV